MIETAVILAAGRGSRLKEITEDRPKGFIVLNKLPIIEESILKLFDAGMRKIFIGTGYHSEKYDDLAKKYANVTCIRNELFATSGSMYTLYRMKEYIGEDFLLLESDLIYDRYGLDQVITSPWPDTLLTSGRTNSGDEAYVEIDQKNCLVNVSKDPKQLGCIYSELVGISKISLHTFQNLCTFAEKTYQADLMLDYEYALVGIARKTDIHVLKVDDFTWSEIDDKKQLDRARNVIYPKISEREGHGKNQA
jgi:2-aminoethylphosphonate-pyruvate transaminase